MVVLKPPPTAGTPAAGSRGGDRKSKDMAASAKPKSNCTAKVHTLKTTIGHNSTLESRDQAYNVSYTVGSRDQADNVGFTVGGRD